MKYAISRNESEDRMYTVWEIFPGELSGIAIFDSRRQVDAERYVAALEAGALRG